MSDKDQCTRLALETEKWKVRDARLIGLLYDYQCAYCSLTTFSFLTVHMHVCKARIYAVITSRS